MEHEEQLAVLLSLLDGSAIGRQQAQNALQRAGGGIEGAMTILFDTAGGGAPSAPPRPSEAPMLIDLEDGGASAEPAPREPPWKQRRVALSPFGGDLPGRRLLGQPPLPGHSSSGGSSSSSLSFAAASAAARTAAEAAAAAMTAAADSGAARLARLLLDPAAKASPSPKAPKSSTADKAQASGRTAKKKKKKGKDLNTPISDSNNRSVEATAPSRMGWSAVADSSDWTLYHGDFTWMAGIATTDPPSLSLSGHQLDSDDELESSGSAHAGKKDFAPGGNDYETQNGHLYVRKHCLDKLFRELLRGLRYASDEMELSFRVKRIDPNERCVPPELRGAVPQRPFKLLDNASDPQAKQAPHFTKDKLRPEQLRSLSWMLMREHFVEAGEEDPADGFDKYVAEWRKYWLPTTVGEPTRQLVRGATVKLVKDAKKKESFIGTVLTISHEVAHVNWAFQGSAENMKTISPQDKWKCPAQAQDVSDLQFLTVNKINNAPVQGLQVGSLVQISPQIHAPVYGWGGCSHRSVGVLLSVTSDVACVKFPEHPTWKGRVDELEALRSSTASSYIVEVRARATYDVRGGILADKIGYGKTATTIALIDSTLRRPLPAIPEIDRASFIPAKGTLVIVPSNLLDQWLGEFAKFTWPGNTLRGRMKNGWAPASCPLKIFAMSNVMPLTKVSVQDLAEADVVICSYRLLFSEIYVTRRREIATGTSQGPRNTLSSLASATKNLIAGRTAIRTGRKGEVYVNNWKELVFPVLEMFYWRRVVFDEFHELESFDSLQQNSLQHMRSHYRWGLTGTPPVHCNAGVIFMSSLFRTDLPGDLFLADRGVEQLGEAFQKWEEDRFLTERSSEWLDLYVRQNTADLPHIKLEEHVVVVQHTVEERVLYLGQAHDAPDLATDQDALKDDGNMEALARLLKLCSHFQAVGDNVANAKEECARIGEQKEKRVVRASNQVFRCSFVIALLENKQKSVAEAAAAAGVANRRADDGSWRQELAKAEEKLGEEGDNGKLVLDQLQMAMREAKAASMLTMLEQLDCHKPKDQDMLTQLGVLDSKRGYGDQWKLFAAKQEFEGTLRSLLKGQAKEQAKNLRELADAQVSRDFFNRTVKAMAADDSPETRSCAVCMEEGLPLTKLAITPCAHAFCTDCLTATIQNFGHCSICRQPLTQKDVRPLALEVAGTEEKKAEKKVATEATPSSSSSSSKAAPKEESGEFARYGTKLAAVVRKLQELRAEDAKSKVILFVQFDDLKRKVATALQDFGIPTVQLQGAVSQRAKLRLKMIVLCKHISASSSAK
eukprot:TRINITY_DN18348_c0_g2_i2.p1 TRINITY_DN18348_c0_g2~~TRINITY_DN18348_c0_g2_i2.p1  ORF type:complete len:1291 (+),score=319.95 TRINITY_DN18348_c0_g2_i2:100-3972(+)